MQQKLSAVLVQDVHVNIARAQAACSSMPLQNLRSYGKALP